MDAILTRLVKTIMKHNSIRPRLNLHAVKALLVGILLNDAVIPGFSQMLAHRYGRTP
jgi:hypothetical protein